MKENSATITIFALPRTFPCGPQSSCCGPVGQSAEQVEELKTAIEGTLGCTVRVLDLDRPENLEKREPVRRLVESFGAAASPIITLEDEVVSMGSCVPDEAVAAIREHMNHRSS